MSTESTNLLRRTLALLGAALSIATATTALGQGTVTLSGASGNSCTYSQMTVTPNGNITVNCGGSGNSQTASFALSHASASSNYVLSPNTSSSATVTRSGGPAEAIMIQFSTFGSGCSSSSGGIMLIAGQSQTIPFTVGAAGTDCTVTIGVLLGTHSVSPNTIRFTSQSGTTPPPPPPPPPPTTGVPGDCPAIPTTSVAGDTAINDFTSFKGLRMASGTVAYFPVPASPNPASVVVEFSQVADTATPGSASTEFQVSRCPGSWDPPGHSIAGGCKLQTGPGNLINLKIWNAPTSNYPSQAALDATGAGGNCLAPSSGGPYYVNVRWTFAYCPYGTSACGFSHRWNQMASNSPY